MFDLYSKTLSQLLLHEEFTFWGVKAGELSDDASIVPLAKGLGAMFYLVLVVDIDALSREQFESTFEACVANIPHLLESDYECVIFLTLFATNDGNFSISSPEFVPGQSFYNVQWIVDFSNNIVKIPDNAPTNVLKIRGIAEKALALCSNGQQDIHSTSFKDIAKNVFSAKYSVSHRPVVTYAILIINIIVWICMEIYGSSTDLNTLVAFGANLNPLNPEWSFYRLFSSVFLHIGVVHLAYNSFSLYIFGVRFEKSFGSYVFLLIYVLSGLSSSFISMFFSEAISAGASCAILGLAGALLILGKKYKLSFHGINTYTILILAISIIALGFVTSGVNNLGHILGFGAGMLIAYIYYSLNTYWSNYNKD